MSRRRQTRRTVAWARYANHYAHDLHILAGSWAAVRAGRHWSPRYRAVHQQGKRRGCRS